MTGATQTLRWAWALGLGLLCASLITGCRLVHGVADMPVQAVRAVTPGSKDKPAASPVAVQQALLRFADEFTAQASLGLDRLRHGTNKLDRAEVLKWKIDLVTETCSVVSGPNAIVNLLDMTVFVTEARAAVEDYWQPKVFGESAQPMLESFRVSETNIWKLAATVLPAPQLAELREAIEAWHRQHNLPGAILEARGVGFATQLAEASKADRAKTGSVFSLLSIDPFAGLDPAMREIAETRLFAERALYVTQKMPALLRWQTELLALHALAMPEIQQMVTNTTQISAAVERFSRVAEQLPKQISTEREEILKALQSQEKGLAALSAEFRQTLAAGSQMSASLNTTITTFDGLMKRFGVGETNSAASAGPPDTNSAPFRIQDYGQTAMQMEGMARQLTELLRTLDQTVTATNLARLTAQVAPVVQQAQAGGKEIVDYAFWKGILLVVIVLVAALIYRILTARLTLAARNRTDQGTRP